MGRVASRLPKINDSGHSAGAQKPLTSEHFSSRKGTYGSLHNGRDGRNSQTRGTTKKRPINSRWSQKRAAAQMPTANASPEKCRTLNYTDENVERVNSSAEYLLASVLRFFLFELKSPQILPKT
jgi:hypothetical protein